MRLGMVGLGKMGANMTRRLMRGGHELVVTDLSADNVKKMAGEGAIASASLDDFVAKLGKPQIAWLMVPAGAPTEQTVQALAQRMQAGDILIDGGNSYFKDDVRRSAKLKQKGIHYVDVGTSGGVWGLERGYCMMIGGPKGSGAATRSDLQDAGSRSRRHSPHSRPRKDAGNRRRRLHPLRPFRRRTLRQNGAQRN